MGLDISYFEKATLAPHGDPDKDWDRFLVVNHNPDFPGRAEGLEDGAIYEVGGAGSFRAGSYGGYNQWRETLAQMAGYPAAPDSDRKQHSAGAWAAKEGNYILYSLAVFG